MTDAAPKRRRGKPFAPGNPGKPKGARHKATQAAQLLLDGEAAKLTRKAIDLALAGDAVALRLCLERLCPVRKDRTVEFTLPVITGIADHPATLAALITAVAAGDVTPAEAQALAAVLEQHRRSTETADLDARIAALEEKIDAAS